MWGSQEEKRLPDGNEPDNSSPDCYPTTGLRTEQNIELQAQEFCPLDDAHNLQDGS